MTLEEAFAEVRRVSRASAPWTGEDFTCAQPEHDPATIDHAIATILNAVVSGDMIPKADFKLAVALAYRRAAEMSREGWMIVAPEGVGQRQALDSYRAQISTNILALADSDPLAEVQALRGEVGRLQTKAMGAVDAARDTEAEVARLREALRDIIDTGGRFGTLAHMQNVDRIARAALQPKAAP